MTRYISLLEFSGKNTEGWQTQPHKNTVQDYLEDVFSKITRNRVKFTGCGRTDSGVNARNYIAHFDALPGLCDTDILYHSNCMLPEEIYIKKIIPADENFHARYSAFSRTYTYRIIFSKSPLRRNFRWYVKKAPDIEKMRNAAELFIGKKDFRNFSTANKDKNTVCCVKDLRIITGRNSVSLKITSDRFVHRMVRMITGASMESGLGRLSVEDIIKMLSGKSSNKPVCAPPDGLTFEKASYGEHYDSLIYKGL